MGNDGYYVEEEYCVSSIDRWKKEVVNWIAVHLLKGYYGKHPKWWDEKLPYVKHAYNHAIHCSTQKTPFEIYFEYLPQSILDFSSET